MQKWIVRGTAPTALPTIHVVSDSTGTTATALARAASASFGEPNAYIEILPAIKSARELTEELTRHLAYHRENELPGAFIVFYTLVDEDLRAAMDEFVAHAKVELDASPAATVGSQEPPVALAGEVIAVDVLAEAHGALARATGQKPVPNPGALYSIDEAYLKRLAAMNFTIDHDDGRNPQDLTKADLVLIGVSRTSKTPLSIYLSQLGYKVANIPLDMQTEPPKQLAQVDPTRIFGLMSSPELLAEVRKRRLGSAAHVAASYSELESVYAELEYAHDLMRKLGCIVIRTDNRAIEETAQEILRYYESAHPQF